MDGTKTAVPIPSLGKVGLQRFAPYLMNRIMGRYNTSLRDHLGAHGLTTPKMRTLAVLSVNNGLMIGDLSVYTVIEQSTMSRTLDQLEEAGLIERRADAADSRARRIFLTDTGRTIFDGIWPALVEAEAAMFEGISDADREHMVTTLQKILTNIRKNPF